MAPFSKMAPSALTPPWSRNDRQRHALSPTLELACELIRRPSVTPLDGCQEQMTRRLAALWLHPSNRMRIEKWTTSGHPRQQRRSRCCVFCRHTDVVPTAHYRAGSTSHSDALIDEDGMLCGRGAADMKGSLASMIIAVGALCRRIPKPQAHRLSDHQRRRRPAHHGTKVVVERRRA